MYTYFPNLTEQVPTMPADGIGSRTFFKNERLKALLFSFDQGQELSEHTAARPAIIHILAGQARLTLGGDEKTASAGTWVYMPAHLSHSVRAETPLTLLLLMLAEGEA